MNGSKTIPDMETVAKTLTQRMDRVRSELETQFDDMLTTRDFRSAIRNLSRSTPDASPSIRKQICSMFERCGIHDVSSTGTVHYYSDLLTSSSIPTPEQLSQRLYDLFFKQFCENPFPSPEEYIARIVTEDGVIDPAWKSDTLRLQILKKFLRDADGFRSAGFKYLSIKRYVSEKAGISSPSMEQMISLVDDDVFGKLNEGLDTIEALERKRNERRRFLDSDAEFQNLIASKSKRAKPSSDIYESDQEYKLISTEIENMNQARKQRNNGRGTYALLRIADDLASGRFGNDSVVREEIYLFSIAFGLTFQDIDRRHSIESVMFRDYYSNNIMRYIVGKHEALRNGGELVNPIGRGINYKNYMEAIFLYYSNRVDLSTADKLKKIYEMAKEAHDHAQPLHEDISESFSEGRTQRFSEELHRLVPDSEEEEFLEFVLTHYDCSASPATSNVFGEENELITAVKVFDELCEDADDYGIFDPDFVLRNL